MSVRIVTDSTSDISQAEAARLGISVVPLNIHAGSRQFRDGVDIQPETFYRRLASSKLLPKTSQPSSGAFLDVYQKLAAETDQILSVHISGKLSGTANAAHTAAGELGGATAVEVIDLGTVSWPLGYAVRQAQEAAAAGKNLEECAAVARDVFERTHMAFVLDTLEYLQKGGRIGRARAWFGTMLNIKPLLTIRDGEVSPVERVRSRTRAEERLFDMTAAHTNAERLAVVHSSSPEEAEAWAERLRTTLPGVPVETTWLGPVLGVYGGPNTLGMAVTERRAE